MHSSNVIHGDLKSFNILFDDEDNPKISDFGLSRQFHTLREANMCAGTAAYIAPEIIRHEKATNKSDVYSFAIIFWELLTGNISWMRYNQGYNNLRTKKNSPHTEYRQVIPKKIIFAKRRPKILSEDKIYRELIELLNDCWNQDRNLRPSSAQIVTRLRQFKDSKRYRRSKREFG